MPPVAVNVTLYGLPAVAADNVDGEDVSAVVTAIERSFVAVWPDESETEQVKFQVPVVVGVPVMLPDPFRVNPAGRLPLVKDQVNGDAPPEAESADEYA